MNPEALPVVPQWSGARVFCSTRHGGVSKPPYDSLNLGLHVGDDPLAVAQNRALLASAWGTQPVFLNQVHGTQLVQLHQHTPDGTQADACWTQEIGVACSIMVADCLPVLFHQPDAKVVAAVHAGWRGLAAGILENTLQALDGFGAPLTWRVWLGPCIGPQAFEVGQEVRDAFALQNPSVGSFRPLPQAEKYLADLPALARQRLKALGLTHIQGNDSSPNWCTYSQQGTYFSHRRDGRSGRFAAGIALI